MPPLVTLKQLSVGFRGPPLLDHVDCQIEAGQRIGLLGRNGAGKTTLMRIIYGELPADGGQLVRAAGARVAWLAQDVPEGEQGRVAEIVARGLQATSLDSASHWQAERQVEQILQRMQLDADADFAPLSSGMKRRVLLAKALVGEPELLLLDEPTNHLDIAAITWLEKFLAKWSGALLFVTHDRMFLRRLATRILEIDRGRLFDWSCDYDTFLARRDAALAEEEKQQALFDKKLAEEERWIRQGIKARRTRNEGRVRAFKQLREDRSQRRERVGAVRMQIQQSQRSGALVADIEDVSFSYGVRVILKHFSTTVMRGDKIGIIGPNGAGKTTLLRVMLGQLAPQQGRVRLGTNQQIAYFDQLREQLDPEKTVAENVGDGYETIETPKGRQHLLGYLQEFLFAPDRARTPVKFLSGGERHRILLAKLFAKPANILVLDEPTNDLDAETLELLEELVAQFSGTVIAVSHDREFLNRIATSTLVFEASGVKEYAGGYDDWLCQSGVDPSQSAPQGDGFRAGRSRDGKDARAPDTPTPDAARPKKRSYKEQQELDRLPQRIEELEAAIQSLHDAMAQPSYYQLPGERIAADQARLAELTASLKAAFGRWEELDQ